MKIRPLLYGFFILLLSAKCLYAQQYGFRSFGLKEGLPQSEVLALIQDNNKNIWIGTNGGGLVRFNGSSFDTYTEADGLDNNLIRSLYHDRSGKLWIGLVNSISVYDGISFSTIRLEDDDKILNIARLYEGADSTMWVLTLENLNRLGLSKIENNRVVQVSEILSEISGDNPLLGSFMSSQGVHYLISQNGLYELEDGKLKLSLLNEYDALQGRIIAPAFQEEDGTIWILSAGPDGRRKIHHYKNGILEDVQLPEDPILPGLNALLKDSQDRLWLGLPGNGVAMLDLKSGSMQYFNQLNGLQSDFIVNFMEDHEGNIWMGSQGSGLIKYSKNNFISYNFDNIINDDVVRLIFQDSGGNFWFSLVGTGLVKYNGSSFIPFIKDDLPGINNTRGMHELEDGSFILASINGLYRFNERSCVEISNKYGLPPNLPYTAMIWIADTMWLSTLTQGVIKLFDGRSQQYSVETGSLVNNIINSIFKDSKDRLWICSTNGVSVYSNGSFSKFSSKDGLRSSIYVHAAEDRFERIWLAGYTSGIDIMEAGGIRNISVSNGLASNNIYSLITDREGNIWAGTQNGVDHIILDSTGDVIAIKNFGAYEGFSGVENNGSAVYRDEEDNLWFGTIKGAMRYNPNEIVANKVKPVTRIKDVRLFFRKVNWGDSIYSDFISGVIPWYHIPTGLVFPSDSNHLSFEFEALSFQIPEKVRYKWILEGLDKDWSPVSARTEAVYPNIPPGNYTFKVMAMNNDGLWNEEPATFLFSIKAPWWITWYFFTLVAIIIFAGIILIFRFRIRRIEAKKAELEAIVRIKTAEVVEQNHQLEQQKGEIEAQADRLKDSYNNLEYLSEIGKLITSQLSVEKIIDTVYESINKVMDAAVFGIGIVNKETNCIDFPGVKEKGKTLDFLSFTLADELRLSTRCVKNKEEIFINDFETEYKKYLRSITPAGKSGNSSSILYLPLIVAEEVLGVITVQSFEKNAYKEYHLNILRNLAVYTKIALENASAYKQIELQSENLKKANRDINRQKQLLEQANTELIELNKEKNHLIGIVAHDLRNPLTSSLTIANNLKSSSNLNGDDKESVGFLVSALDRMHEMILKILDIRIIEQKKINMNCERTDLGEVIETVYKNFSKTASEKSINLSLENQQVFGTVDRNYLMQVFENLLSNAIKFSPPNKTVRIKVEEENGDVRVNFIDQGPGIKKEDMKKLFGKYQRLSAKPTAGEQSTGLGLSIVKKYVDVMGGRVWCESEDGAGSNFIVSFRKSD